MLVKVILVPAVTGAGKDVNLNHNKLTHVLNAPLKFIHEFIEGSVIDIRDLHVAKAFCKFVHEFNDVGKIQDLKVLQLKKAFCKVCIPVAFDGSTMFLSW